jgi:hypothetical protein
LELEEERAEAQERAGTAPRTAPSALKAGFLDAKPRRKAAETPAAAPPPPPQASLAFTQTVRERETAPPVLPGAPEAPRPKSKFKAAREAAEK